MTVKVLVVDDSGFFRRRLSEILSSDPAIQVVGVASNGREGVQQAQALHPDVITMDYEMPTMDGITAVRHIMQECPTAILMFSSLTHEGARVTLDALDAGAVDYLPKNFEDISRHPDKVRQLLCERVKTIARTSRYALSRPAVPPSAEPSLQPSVAPRHPEPQRRPVIAAPPVPARTAPVASRPLAVEAEPPPRRSAVVGRRHYQLVVLGTSTGGPVALQRVLTALPAGFPSPLLLVQHMPGTFTRAFAERLDQMCRIRVKEAEEGDQLRPGLALLAPGGKQLMVDARGSVRILAGDERLNYKPSVDVTFGSAARAYQDRVLAVVMTGMGADGREGARMLKNAGSRVWTQTESSCVIYGMPMAVDKAGLSDASFDLDEIGPKLTEACH